MTTPAPEPLAHLPAPTEHRCDRCQRWRRTSEPACTCGAEAVDDARAVCDADLEPWPCPAALAAPDAAVLAWAHGDRGFEGAAHLVLTSPALRPRMLPRYLEWSPWQLWARPDFDALAKADDAGTAYLAGSARVLLTLAANLAHGPAGAGEGLNLSAGLSRLDRDNRQVVLEALRTVLAVGR